MNGTCQLGIVGRLQASFDRTEADTALWPAPQNCQRSCGGGQKLHCAGARAFLDNRSTGDLVGRLPDTIWDAKGT